MHVGALRLPGRNVLLGSWVASAALVVFTAVQRLSDNPPSGAAALAGQIGGLIALAACAAGFARTQWLLFRGITRSGFIYTLLGLGLLPAAWATPNAAPAFGLAAALAAFGRARAAIVWVWGAALFVALYRGGGRSSQVPVTNALAEIVVMAVIFATLTHFAVTLDRLDRAREQLARHRIDQERERVNRDLHDIMGRTLVTAALRTQTMLRTLPDTQTDAPSLAQAHARRELLAVQDALRSGQEQVRALTASPTLSDWHDEIEVARVLCDRVGIRFLIDPRVTPGPEHATTAGLVVRETVTFALAHSRAGFIEVTGTRQDDATIITIRHDGTAPLEQDQALPARVREALRRSDARATVIDDGAYRELRLEVPDRRKGTS